MNRRAALLDREENKYVVSFETLRRMRDQLAETFDLLDIGGTAVFGYETIYFDTPEHLTYRQHAQNRRLRMKVRTRHYVDSGLCFFEVKLKGTRGRTLKQRMDYDLERHGHLDEQAEQFLGQSIQQVYGQTFDEPLVPSLGMRYERLTLVGRCSPERVTMDFALSFEHPSGTTAAAPEDLVIVEVKSPDGHGLADRLFAEQGHRSTSCSKYCVGLLLLEPDLPYHRFKTILARHFDWSPPAIEPAGTEPADDQPTEPEEVGLMPEATFQRIETLLAEEFPSSPGEVVRTVLDEELRRFEDSSVHHFLPVLVHRAARRRLSGV